MKQDRRCRAKLTNGERRCKNSAIRGGVVCAKHGGSAPQVRAAADRRLEDLIDPAIRGLSKALESDDHGALIRAAQVVLDRTGHGPTSKVEMIDKMRRDEFSRVLKALEAAGITDEQLAAAQAALETADGDTIH